MTAAGRTGRLHTISVLVFDGVRLLDVAAFAEVIAEANLIQRSYELRLVSPNGMAVRTSVGAMLTVAASAFDVDRSDSVLVGGADSLELQTLDPLTVAATRHLADGATRVASVCTGAFYLAEAGLLTGRRVTTHWGAAPSLDRRYPDVHVVPDRLFVEDGNVFTCAGMTSGTDLALAFVERDQGAATAERITTALVSPGRRLGEQSQRPRARPVDPGTDRTLQRVIHMIEENPAEPHTVSSLAAAAAVSTRQLHRLFVTSLALTPSQHLRKTRVDLARSALDRGESVSDAARQGGFADAPALRRAFITELHLTPAAYAAARQSSAERAPTGT